MQLDEFLWIESKIAFVDENCSQMSLTFVALKHYLHGNTQLPFQAFSTFQIFLISQLLILYDADSKHRKTTTPEMQA